MLWMVALVLCSSCSKTSVPASEKGAGFQRYVSEFPSPVTSLEIENITHSVKKVYSVSSYITYQFKREARITGYHLRSGIYQNAAWGVITTNETVFGTATVIAFSNSRVALLTCAHVVTSPDTLISFFEPTDEDPVQYIRSFAIRNKQENWVKELSSCGSFTVLATDIGNDIAFLGKNCESLTDTVIPLAYPSGHARELGWGSLAWIFGYPMGNQVITRGIVSLTAKRPLGEFSVDALLNKGYSGGAILALTRGAAGFELVGMVKTVASTHEEFLTPAKDQPHSPDWMPYHGDLFIGNSDRIQYGLNAVVPAESIYNFYEKHRAELIKNGYNLDHFFHPGKPK